MPYRAVPYRAAAFGVPFSVHRSGPVPAARPVWTAAPALPRPAAGPDSRWRQHVLPGCLSCPVLSCPVLFCSVLLCLVLLCLVLLCLVLLCLVLSYPVLHCPALRYCTALPCPALSCPVLFCIVHCPVLSCPPARFLRHAFCLVWRQ